MARSLLLAQAGPLGVSAMAALAAVIFIEKIRRYGQPFGQAVGLALLAVGALAIWFPGCSRG